MITIKSPRELEKMRVSGRIVAELLQKMGEWVRPGITTLELDRRSEAFIREREALPAFKGYRGFKHTICASVNEEVVHGIPGQRKLRDGDLFTADVGAKFEGYYGDAARTFCVGEVAKQGRDLCETTRRSLDAAIAAVRPGAKLSDIARSVQGTAERAGYSVVRRYVGHGIGTALHEDPQVPNYVSRDLLEHDVTLQPGMVLAIEPMLNCGTHEVELLEDGWTVVTADRELSAHFEDTVAVTQDGHEVFSRL